MAKHTKAEYKNVLAVLYQAVMLATTVKALNENEILRNSLAYAEELLGKNK